MPRSLRRNPLKLEKLDDGRVRLSRADGEGESLVLAVAQFTQFLRCVRRGHFDLERLVREA